MKSAQIWVSAVIYMALGVIILTLVLTAGIPVVNKIRDKNLVIQTKELMNTLDKNIRTVYSEGPGSKRPIKITIEKGDFIINENNDVIQWSFDSSFQLSESGIEIKEGNLYIRTDKTPENTYLINLKLNYSSLVNITTNGATNNFAGTNKLIITNLGAQPPDLPKILLEVV